MMSDATGDARVPRAGLDLTSLRVARPNPLSPSLRFRLEVADMIPGGVGTTPETTTYTGDLLVGSRTVDLQAWRSAQNHQAGSTDPFFSVNTCEPNATTGGETCTSTSVTGTWGDGFVEWTVPAATIGAANGTVLESTAFASSIGVSGLVWYGAGNSFGNHDQMYPDTGYAYGDPTVTVTVVDANGAVLKETSTKPKTNGSYSADLDVSQLAAGDYTVVANACYQSSCAATQTPLTLS